MNGTERFLLVAALLGAVTGRAAAEGAAAASGPAALLDLLRPGSHASLGLGGDPFLSPLDDQLGWWSRLGIAEPPGSRATFDTSRPLDFGGGGDFRSGANTWTSHTRGRWTHLAWSAGLGIERPSWSGGWDHASGRVALDGSGTGTAGGARVELVPGLAWQFAGTTGSPAGPAAFGAGARYRGRSGSGLQASWQRERSPARLASSLYGEPIAVAANLVRETQRVEGRWVSPWSVALEAAVARERWLPFASTGEELAYHFTPSGTAATDQAGLRWSGAERAALLRWTRFRPDLAGDLAWGGQRFGGLDYARATLDSWLAAFESGTPDRRVVVEIERVRLQAAGRGTMESWPFTSTLADLLGQRVVFRGMARAGWERAHLGYQRALKGRARARAGVEWVELRPEAWLESWRPAFLVFGKVDDRIDALDVRRAQLGIVALGASFSTAAVDLDLALEQCVFARTFERGSAAAEPPAATGATQAPAMHATETGTHARLSVSRRF